MWRIMFFWALSFSFFISGCASEQVHDNLKKVQAVAASVESATPAGTGVHEVANWVGFIVAAGLAAEQSYRRARANRAARDALQENAELKQQLTTKTRSKSTSETITQ